MCSACETGTEPKNGTKDGAVLLSVDSFEVQNHFSMDPLRPHFNKAQIWKALSLADEHVLIGYNDGRVHISNTDGSDAKVLSTGAPILAGGAPIHALVSWGALTEQGGFFTTSPTYIPYGAAAPELRPPSTHPRASSLIAIDHSGAEAWSWQGEINIQGMLIQEKRSEVLIGSGDRISDQRRDLYGVYIFDGGDQNKQDRLVSKCLTPSPVSFNFDETEDGRIAVIEHPYLDEDGGLKGKYQLRVFR